MIALGYPPIVVPDKQTTVDKKEETKADGGILTESKRKQSPVKKNTPEEETRLV